MARIWYPERLRALALAPGLLEAVPEGVRQGLKLMKGEKIEKQITLPTLTIDASNAEQIMKENGLL